MKLDDQSRSVIVVGNTFEQVFGVLIHFSPEKAKDKTCSAVADLFLRYTSCDRRPPNSHDADIEIWAPVVNQSVGPSTRGRKTHVLKFTKSARLRNGVVSGNQVFGVIIHLMRKAASMSPTTSKRTSRRTQDGSGDSDLIFDHNPEGDVDSDNEMDTDQ
ncbi:unnamed protein product [Penicillium salamii]|nr:unnamed protein product [Penicillium salamii]CAG8168720.1 unnamed protein product [Penicillium salamii]CAG8247489.1 unnamed protein product [Penicillium salamii]